MSNLAFTSVCIIGDDRQLRSLYGKMVRLERRKKSLVENGFYYPNRWLGNLACRLGSNYFETDCRGTWSDLKLKRGVISFSTETASEPPYKWLRLIERCYSAIKIFFEAEGDWDFYLTNDTEGRFFPMRFYIETESDDEYFSNIEELSEYVSKYIGKRVSANKSELYDVIMEWNDRVSECDKEIRLKEIELLTDKEW